MDHHKDNGIQDESFCFINSDFSDESSDNNDTEEDNSIFVKELINWIFKSNISTIAVTELLKILNSHFSKIDLPMDARTPLQTPRKQNYSSMGSGKFVYFGLKFVIYPMTVIQY